MAISALIKRIPITGIALVALTSMHLHGVAGDVPGKQSLSSKANYGFIENKGQIIDQHDKPNPSCLYLLNSSGLNVQLRKNGFSYDAYQIGSRQSAIDSTDSRDHRIHP